MKKRHYDVHGGNGKNMNQGNYAGVDARRKLEREDAGMISEDHSAIANMPREVMMKQYASAYGEGLEGLNDTITGIDRQTRADGNEMHRFKSKSKY